MESSETLTALFIIVSLRNIAITNKKSSFFSISKYDIFSKFSVITIFEILIPTSLKSQLFRLLYL